MACKWQRRGHDRHKNGRINGGTHRLRWDLGATPRTSEPLPGQLTEGKAQHVRGGSDGASGLDGEVERIAVGSSGLPTSYVSSSAAPKPDLT